MPSEEASATFSAAVAGLRSCQDQVRQIRPELCFEEVPAPRTLAPFATAVGAAVRVDGAEIATGRFVLLYDPAGQRGWAGPLRVIVYIRADLEPEIAEDPMVGEVAWSWLIEALDARSTECGGRFLARHGDPADLPHSPSVRCDCLPLMPPCRP